VGMCIGLPFTGLPPDSKKGILYGFIVASILLLYLLQGDKK